MLSALAIHSASRSRVVQGQVPQTSGGARAEGQGQHCVVLFVSSLSILVVLDTVRLPGGPAGAYDRLRKFMKEPQLPSISSHDMVLEGRLCVSVGSGVKLNAEGVSFVFCSEGHGGVSGDSIRPCYCDWQGKSASICRCLGPKAMKSGCSASLFSLVDQDSTTVGKEVASAQEKYYRYA